jgi:hypothetical protein
MAKPNQVPIPYLDPSVQHVGVSKLRALNIEQLRDLNKTLVIQDNDNPLAVLLKYEHFMAMQERLLTKGSSTMRNSNIDTPLFSGGGSGDYLRLECNQCRELCSFAFLGFDPTIPLARVTCPNHGTLWEGKVDGFDIVATSEAKRQR